MRPPADYTRELRRGLRLAVEDAERRSLRRSLWILLKADTRDRVQTKLDGAVEFLKERKDDDYTDYMSCRVVDMWMEAYVGFLMLESAARNPARVALAQKYVADVLPRIEMNYRVVTSGDAMAIENWKEMLEV